MWGQSMKLEGACPTGLAGWCGPRSKAMIGGLPALSGAGQSPGRSVLLPGVQQKCIPTSLSSFSLHRVSLEKPMRGCAQVRPCHATRSPGDYSWQCTGPGVPFRIFTIRQSLPPGCAFQLFSPVLGQDDSCLIPPPPLAPSLCSFLFTLFCFGVSLLLFFFCDLPPPPHTISFFFPMFWQCWCSSYRLGGWDCNNTEGPAECGDGILGWQA